MVTSTVLYGLKTDLLTSSLLNRINVFFSAKIYINNQKQRGEPQQLQPRTPAKSETD